MMNRPPLALAAIRSAKAVLGDVRRMYQDDYGCLVFQRIRVHALTRLLAMRNEGR